MSDVRLTYVMILASAWLFGGAAAQAAPGEQLVMPYACAVEKGRVQVRPASSTNYAIVGKREQQSLTVCRPGTGDDCRTFMVHSFSISCGGVRVPWVQVAAAARGSVAPRSWIDDGRLHMLLATRSTTPRCADHALSFLKNMGVSAVPECMPWQRRIKADLVVMPRGFAPVGQYGARLALLDPKLVRKPVLVRGPSAETVQQASSASAPPAHEAMAVAYEEEAVARELAVWSWSAAARASAASTIETGSITPVAYTPHAVDEVPVRETEVAEIYVPREIPRDVSSVLELGNYSLATIVNAVKHADISGMAAGRLSLPFIWVSLVLFLSTLTWFAWRPDHAAAGPAMPRGEGWPPRNYANPPSLGSVSHAPMRVDLANAGETCAALLAQTQITVENLSSAGPLRDVLIGELAQVRQRLASTCVLAVSGGEASQRAATHFRALVREIERIRRIAESAAASIPTGAAAAGNANNVPRTRSEAYGVLGINPDVSDAVAKKIVDGLRASWHPDHAKDEEDLQVREARIKQINVAWELISEKRNAA